MSRFIQQSNRRIQRCRTQVHVPLRRLQVLMPGQFLDGPRQRSTHRQMRTERVPQDVNPRPHAPLRAALGTLSCTIFIVSGSPLD